MKRAIPILILIVGLVIIGIGVYPYLKKPDPPVPVIVESKPKSKDISDTYGIVRGTVFNKKTHVVFGDGFLQEAGFTSFDGLIFDVMNKLPPNLTLPDGRPLTEKERYIIEHRKVN
jgi:hypothetical protein